MDENNVIGYNNDLPWKLPADLKYFKKKTLEKTILMGRNTCESLPFSLPKRKNIVLTRNINFSRKGFETIHTVDSINELDGEIMVIGGAMIYKLLMPFADRLLITKIKHKFVGDRYFEWHEEDWQVDSKEDHKADDVNPYDYSFLSYTPR
jgi:dihydrofolate reductase